MRARRALAALVLLLAGQLIVDAQRGGGGAGGGAGGGRGGGGGGRVGGPPSTNPGPQQPNQPDGSRRNDQLVFRAGVTLVQIDAYVTDAAGNPVTGLKAEDFEVLEAGKPREVTTFAAVDIPIDPPVGLPVTTRPRRHGDERESAEPHVSHRPRRGRQRIARCAPVIFLRRFIERNFGPSDVAAVALTGRGLATRPRRTSRTTRS